jgi:hypothetical protein
MRASPWIPERSTFTYPGLFIIILRESWWISSRGLPAQLLPRLTSITAAVFSKRNPLPKLEASIDICVHILLQLAAHRYS